MNSYCWYGSINTVLDACIKNFSTVYVHKTKIYICKKKPARPFACAWSVMFINHNVREDNVMKRIIIVLNLINPSTRTLELTRADVISRNVHTWVNSSCCILCYSKGIFKLDVMMLDFSIKMISRLFCNQYLIMFCVIIDAILTVESSSAHP